MPYNSVPLVYRNVVVVGANTPPGTVGGIGNPRAFDARTGAKLWEFSSVRAAGRASGTTPGRATAGKAASAPTRGRSTSRSTSSAGFSTCRWRRRSPARTAAIARARTCSATQSSRSTSRPARTSGTSRPSITISGTHDPPAPPGTVRHRRGTGARVPALGVTTKSGYLYILNRETGAADLRRRRACGCRRATCPASRVSDAADPGEAAAAGARRATSRRISSPLRTRRPSTRRRAPIWSKRSGGVYNAGPFTPWAYRAEGAPPRARSVFPGGLGGANWGGTAFDPASGFVFVVTQDVGALGWMEKAQEGSPVPYDKADASAGRGTFDVRDRRRELAVPETAMGTPDRDQRVDRRHRVAGAARHHRATARRTSRTRAGRCWRVRSSPPAASLFIASTDDNRFRALDAKTGRELWVTTLERRGNANPITYQGRNGQQYVAIVATDTLSVFALPQK